VETNSVGKAQTADGRKSKRMLPIVPDRTIADTSDIHALLIQSKDKLNETVTHNRIELFVDEPLSVKNRTINQGDNIGDDTCFEISHHTQHLQTKTKTKILVCDSTVSLRRGSELVDGTNSIDRKINLLQKEVEYIVNIDVDSETQQPLVDPVKYKNKSSVTLQKRTENVTAQSNTKKNFQTTSSTVSGRAAAKDGSNGPTFRCRSKPPAVVLTDSKTTGGRTSAPPVAPTANREQKVSRFDRSLTPRSRSRPSGELEFKVFNAGPVASAQNSLKNTTAQVRPNVVPQHQGRYIKCDAPVGRSQYATVTTPPAVAMPAAAAVKTATVVNLSARQRSMSRPRVKPQVSTPSSNEVRIGYPHHVVY